MSEVTPTPPQRGKDKKQEDYQQQEGPRSLTSDGPETMTPDEAENLLSSRWVLYSETLHFRVMADKQ
jgi:hypothetical protein